MRKHLNGKKLIQCWSATGLCSRTAVFSDLSDGMSSLVKLLVKKNRIRNVFEIVQNKNDSAQQLKTIILKKLVIGFIHGKCLLTQNPKNKHKK